MDASKVVCSYMHHCYTSRGLLAQVEADQ